MTLGMPYGCYLNNIIVNRIENLVPESSCYRHSEISVTLLSKIRVIHNLVDSRLQIEYE